MKLKILLMLMLAGPLGAIAGDVAPRAMYLANEGVMVESGDTRILFDPLFRYRSDYYQRVPAIMEHALFNGQAPFQDIDAVFISHYHADHYAPELILRLLKAQPGIHLFAPAQAVEQLAAISGDTDSAVFERITPVALEYPGSAWTSTLDKIEVGAVLIPHSGWPKLTTEEVQNIAWRVTLEGRTTVLHMGDADPDPRHFKPHDRFWEDREIGMAFPPHWFFLSKGGLNVLARHLDPVESVGVHIAADPRERDTALAAFDVFTHPGETRLIESRKNPEP